MKCKVVRIIIGVLTAFVALTAIGGGLALLTGAEGNRFPLAWLQGTPFDGYTIPGLILAVIVGGSALIASVFAFRGRKVDVMAMTCGVLLAGFVSTEALILKQTPPGPTVMELLYFVIGAGIFGLAAYLRRAEQQPADR